MKKDIYQNKKRISKLKQPKYDTELNILDDKLNEFKIEHPFDLDDKQRVELCDCMNCYHTGAHGEVANLAGMKYLYRLVPIERLIKSKLRWKDYVIPTNNAFQELTKFMSARNISWLKLSEVLEGYYHNGRFFSWWTTVNLANDKDILKTAYMLGLPEDWIYAESVIMRCKIQEIGMNKIKVPSIIDGFSEIIFRPVTNTQFHGKTIDLNDLNPFNGLPEVVIGDILTSHIEILPIQITKKNVNDTFDMWLERGTPNKYSLQGKLLDFYEKIK